VIPTHNRADVLRSCLQAVDAAAAGLEGVEVVVVDDGSRDETPAVLAATRLENASFLTDRTDGRGPATARNLGVRAASSPIVLFLGDDILVEPGLLRRHLEFHSGGGEAGRAARCLIGEVALDPSAPQTRFSRFVHSAYQFNPAASAKDGRLPWHCFHTANASMPRQAFLDAGGFDERFPYAAWEDVEFAYRLGKAGVGFYYDPEAVGFHRHEMTLRSYAARQERSGRAAALLLEIHPELADLVTPRRRLPGPLRAVLQNRVNVAALTGLAEAAEKCLPERAYRMIVGQVLAYHYYRGMREAGGRA
jgi:GT2 family glycosyltransferase